MNRKYQKILRSPLGDMLAVANQDYLYSLTFVGQDMQRDHNVYQSPETNRLLIHLEYELSQYFAGRLRIWETPINIMRFTDFQQQVFEQLQKVPFGSTVSYQYIADCIGNRRAVRAVARTIGVNQYALIIPCHRITYKYTGIGGYNAGVVVKQSLLRHEAQYTK